VSPGGPLVLLVSLDTVRADALSGYADTSGWGQDLPASSRPIPSTPILDELAESGLRFRWALAHAPTTLASHASVFSGRDPLSHGVYRNGVPIGEEVPLFTEEISRLGYETMAILGSSVLESTMGLDRGFDLYDDQVQQVVRARTEDPAERVNSRVISALAARDDPSRPLFLFVHYFDAHSPWDSAAPDLVEDFTRPDYQGMLSDGSGAAIGALATFARRGRLGTADRIQARGLYLAEVAHVDRALGRLLEELERQGYLDDSLIVAFGDHGEVLDEIPERAYGHGPDVDLAAIHVPLIMAAQGSFSARLPAGRAIDTPASLKDLPSTILDVVDGRVRYQDGHSLLPAREMVGQPPRPHLAEATKPHLDTPGWPNQALERAVVLSGGIYLRAPWLGEDGSLYKLAPGQPVLDHPTLAHELEGVLDAWQASAPSVQTVPLDEQTRLNLEALGYTE
jgi:arylsulfatase A-like enzyme